MVANAGGNYGPVFQSHRVLAQGDLLSPKIFNVFIKSVIQHWVTVVGPPQEGAEHEGLGTSIQTLSELLYDGDGQGAFNIPTGLFDRVGLRTNKGKMVSMACRPCHTPPRMINGGLHLAIDGTRAII